VGVIQIKPMRYGAPVSQHLVSAIMAELTDRYGGDGEGDETPLEAVEFDPPEGLFLVAWLDGEPVGCGGWRTLSHFSDPDIPEDVAEIKRMYTSPTARKRGVAATVLSALEESAREVGMKRVVLETGTPQPEAIGLYERAGYTRIPNYGYYRDSPLCVCYGRDL
jgi:GNAT superfamily N-acetyltransferase